MKVYLDNAATTRPDPLVVEAMLPYLQDHFGNPSSTHSFGREAKSALELSRKKIAEIIGASPSEIFFTSGGTEADNTSLAGFIETFRIMNVITSPLEHHAVIHILEHLKKLRGINLIYLDVDPSGEFHFDQLDYFLKNNKPALVSLMHANNEIGNLNDLDKITHLCKDHHAYFHSDTVQSIGKIPIDLKQTRIDSIAASGHKFHGPKGTGFNYIRNISKIGPYLHGGGQERNMRSGTENVAGIVGLAKALEIANDSMQLTSQKILDLKKHMIDRLIQSIPGIQFNGQSANPDKSLYTILNINLPPSEKLDMLLFQLELKQIAASGGSACGSGALAGSHVLDAIKADPKRPAVRFSFSKYNSLTEVDYAVDTLLELINK